MSYDALPNRGMLVSVKQPRLLRDCRIEQREQRDQVEHCTGGVRILPVIAQLHPVLRQHGPVARGPVDRLGEDPEDDLRAENAQECEQCRVQQSRLPALEHGEHTRAQQGTGDDRTKLGERRDVALKKMMELPNGIITKDSVPLLRSLAGLPD